MDIKVKIEELVNKVRTDKNFASKFKDNPIKAVESALGVDLPDEQIKKVVDGVKAKISAGDIADKAGGILDKAKKLF